MWFSIYLKAIERVISVIFPFRKHTSEHLININTYFKVCGLTIIAYQKKIVESV